MTNFFNNFFVSINLIIISYLIIGYFIYRIRFEVSQILKYKIGRLEDKNSMLNKSLNDKELLLKEFHHRVKNNLQLVLSILSIQANDCPDISVNELLDKCHYRISSIALIHQNLYMTGNLNKVDFQTYTEELVTNIIKSFSNIDFIRHEIFTNNNQFNLQTSISLGLIISELASNSIKHAFKDNIAGVIYIEINRLDNNSSFELIFGDNGCGTNDLILVEKATSFGLELVELLVSQLNGNITKIDKEGTFYRVIFQEINNPLIT